MAPALECIKSITIFFRNTFCLIYFSFSNHNTIRPKKICKCSQLLLREVLSVCRERKPLIFYNCRCIVYFANNNRGIYLYYFQANPYAFLERFTLFLRNFSPSSFPSPLSHFNPLHPSSPTYYVILHNIYPWVIRKKKRIHFIHP